MRRLLEALVLILIVLVSSTPQLIGQNQVDSLNIVSIDINPAGGQLLVDVIAFQGDNPIELSTHNLRFTEIEEGGTKDLLKIEGIKTTSTPGIFRVELFDNLIPYKGGESTLIAEWFLELKEDSPESSVRASRRFSFGSLFNQIPALFGTSKWIGLFTTGIGILLALFAILTLLMPILKRAAFRKNHVEPHRRVGNTVVLDTVLNEPIQEGTMVVTVCRQLIPLTVWEGMGERCPHFPDCIHSLKCDGAGGKAINSSYFSNTEDMRKWNWLMFGAIGGFIGWFIYAIFKSGIANIDFHVRLVRKALSYFGSTHHYAEIANDAFYGICIGAGFALSFSLLERFQGVLKVSWIVTILKIVAGAVLGGFSFFIGALSSAVIPDFLSGILSWMIFGILLGIVISIKSNISRNRAIIAGMIASICSFLIFYVAFVMPMESSQLSTEFFKLLSLLVLGSIMGFTIISVVSSLEEFEFEVISPNERRGYKFPISKWIEQGVQISIGKSPKAQIFIKWNDEDVLQNHANVYVKNDRVHIHASGETLLNGQLLTSNTHTTLKNLDVIQLGRHSNTQLRFNEKRKQTLPQRPEIAPSSSKGKGY